MKPIVAAALAAALVSACGKKGPPLPPLVRIPAAPDLKAVRRGSTVDLQLTVPSANTDGTKPANIERLDVYGFTGSPATPDADVFKRGTRLATLEVKAPRDPDEAAEPEEPADEVEPPTGRGLDQGAVAHVEEQLNADMFKPVDLSSSSRRRSASRDDRPLLGPLAGAPSRVYVGVGVNKSGRRGRGSAHVVVSLAPAPPAPTPPTISYTESTITVTWKTPPSPATGAPESSAGVLPSHPIGLPEPPLAYNVYDGAGALLTKSPVAEPHFEDARIEWGAERCYAIRSVRTIGSLAVESDAGGQSCKTLVDTFAPAPPKGLQAVSTGGAVSLIWDASSEKDLAGYIVLRAIAPSEQLEPIVSMPIADPTFTDAVQPGARYFYAVQAVDKAGNRSEPSARVEQIAR